MFMQFSALAVTQSRSQRSWVKLCVRGRRDRLVLFVPDLIPLSVGTATITSGFSGMMRRWIEFDPTSPKTRSAGMRTSITRGLIGALMATIRTPRKVDLGCRGDIHGAPGGGCYPRSHGLPPRLRRLLHCALDLHPDSRYAQRQAGRIEMRAALR